MTCTSACSPAHTYVEPCELAISPRAADAISDLAVFDAEMRTPAAPTEAGARTLKAVRDDPARAAFCGIDAPHEAHNYISGRASRWCPGGIDITPAADVVNHPAHYTSHPSGIECIEITEHMGFNLGNVVKYVWRADLKGDLVEDLRKAAWYLQREIDRREIEAERRADEGGVHG